MLLVSRIPIRQKHVSISNQANLETFDPLCWRVTNFFFTLARRDEEGAVILEPRNFTTKKCKTGRIDAVYLSKPSYVSVEDPFKKPIEKVFRSANEEGHKPTHDVKFKPAKHVREKYYKAPFDHMVDRVEVKKDYRDADGAVITAPKNFYTYGPKQGETGKACYFNKFPEHVPDDYNYPKKVATEEMQAGKKLEQEKPFSQRARELRKGVFETDKSAYDIHTEIPAKRKREDPKPPIE